MALIQKYYHWLHGKWPAGTVEKLPEVGEDGATNVSGIRVVGDLSGIPLLKFSSDTGAKAVRAFLAEPDFAGQRDEKSDDVVDIAIIGGGVSGISAAIEAEKAGLSYVLYEASEVFYTVANFPKGKPIYTYPTEMTPSGGIQYSPKADVKEALLEEMKAQVAEHGVRVTPGRIDKVERKGKRIHLHHAGGEEVTEALRCVIAIGRSGNFRKMGIPGEDLDKVSNRLHDPMEYAGKNVLVVGGGDSAAESAIALAACGANVTLSYRGKELNRPKPENIAKVEALAADPCVHVEVTNPVSDRVTTAASSEMRGDKQPGCLHLKLGTSPSKITNDKVTLKSKEGDEEEIDNEAVFSMIGREAPLPFFRRSGIRIKGEWTRKTWYSLGAILLFFICFYHWKAWAFGLSFGIRPENWFNLEGADKTTFWYQIKDAFSRRDFYYALAYSTLVVIFGIRRVKRRKTPYVKKQTITLAAIQVLPLFLLPYFILPYLTRVGAFDAGFGQWFADQFFPLDSKVEGEREYWRSIGFILAWPLFAWNWFTEEPLVGWLIVGFIQTFVLIPWMVRKWGKGAYCGWICSCGALAETLGDTQRHKMPHGPKATKWNMIGQVFLFFGLFILLLRIVGWIIPGEDFADKGFKLLATGIPILNFKYMVDLIWAGIIGVALYFHFSGRVWCRFACPLAALMHIYARFTKFRIFSEKSKCISCNVCTSVCHQGIDIMNFANKGKPMEDPECVRCSACVQQCPTGVLSFGRLEEGQKIVLDKLPASPVQMREAAAKKEGGNA